jgi:catechol 2,3-dioxygenase-like lactoylglutathione lyase family enzyme
MATVSVRYIVDDVDAALAFYCQHLGFEEQMHPTPAFAMLTCGDLRLLVSAPGGGSGGGQAMPDGTLPTPGGWESVLRRGRRSGGHRRPAPRGRRPCAK